MSRLRADNYEPDGCAEADDATINVDGTAKLTTLTINAAANVTGKGTIETAKVNVSGQALNKSRQHWKRHRVTVSTGTKPDTTNSSPAGVAAMVMAVG